MFALAVARRYLFSSPAQTLLLVVGVALGVSAYVFITALVAGLAIRLTNDVTLNSSHVSLEPRTRLARVLPSNDAATESVALVSTLQRQQIRNWRAIVELIREQPQVATINPQISGNAFLVKGQAVAPVAVTAVEPAELDAISPISTELVSGEANLGGDAILIGAKLADRLGLVAGQPVLFRTDRGVDRSLVVRGIYRTGLQSLDERVAYLSLQTARPLFLLPEGVTNIEIKLERPAEARKLATFLAEATNLEAIPWQARNETLEQALAAQGQSGRLIQMFSLISVLIGIASALILSVNRRRAEIGIMRAFGLSRRFIASVFVLQGLMVGVLGAALGCLTGYGLCSWLATLVRPDGTSALPIAPSEGGYAAVLILTTIGATLASLFPARAAARLDPLEAIQQ